ncbi:hypothetical protein SDC9_142429 [bioreactor metagenome]|uniref:Uncharacterized protein n=1 Tax=bioreactor metagenome TaxID=1076179 RepID=A0A645E137_9ZZZZ
MDAVPSGGVVRLPRKGAGAVPYAAVALLHLHGSGLVCPVFDFKRQAGNLYSPLLSGLRDPDRRRAGPVCGIGKNLPRSRLGAQGAVPRPASGADFAFYSANRQPVRTGQDSGKTAALLARRELPVGGHRGYGVAALDPVGAGNDDGKT